MENTVHQLFLVLCRPNKLNFTEMIAVTFTTVRPVARISQQGAKNHKGGGTFFKYGIDCMHQQPRKKSLATCKLHLPRPRKLYKYERRTGRAP